MIKISLKTNLEEKKIPKAHILVHHQPFRYSASNQNSSITLNLVIIFSSILSGEAFTSNPKEIQGRFSKV